MTSPLTDEAFVSGANQPRLPKQRLLVCVDWFAPGSRAGGPIQSCTNLVRMLHEDLRIFVLTGDRDLGSDVTYPGVCSGRWNNWGGMARVRYATRQQHLCGAFLRAVRRTRPQAIYLNSMFSLFGTIVPTLIQSITGRQTRLVLAPRGMLKPSAVAFRSWKKTPWLALVRRSGIGRLIQFHATSHEEADEIRNAFGDDAKVQVIPNIPRLPVSFVSPSGKQLGRLRLSFVGRVHPVKNLLFLLHVLQSIRCQCDLDVIGPIEDAEYYAECRRQIALLPQNVAVTFSGALGHEDVMQTLEKSDAMVLPTLGENFGHSIFESLSLGVPVLISDQTCWRQLADDKAGWDLNLSNSKRFAEVLEQLGAMTADEHQELRNGAHQRAVQFFRQHDLRDSYLRLFSEHSQSQTMSGTP